MPSRIEDLSSISIDLSNGFDLDVPVQRIFSTHPLKNAIMMDYFCNGERNAALGLETLFGITKEPTFIEAARARYREPKDVPVQFWELHQRWNCPSMQMISTWRLDLVTIVFRLVNSYGRSSTDPVYKLLNSKLPGLVGEMKKEFPDAADGFDRVFEQTGFRNVQQLYRSQLDTRSMQAARVYYVDPGRPNQHKLFNVINYCVRLLKECRTAIIEGVGGQDDVKREFVEQAIAIGENVQTNELKLWPYIAQGLNVKERTVNLNTEQFWQIPMVETLVQFPDDTEAARELIQLMFLYSDIDPSTGLDAAIEEEVHNTQHQDWVEVEGTNYWHTSQRPMKDQPWQKANSLWQDGSISRGNWEMIKEFLRQIPRVEMVYRQKGLRHDGELKYAGLQATFPGPLELRPSVEYFEERAKVDTIPAKETNYLPFLVGAAVAGYFILA